MQGLIPGVRLHADHLLRSVGEGTAALDPPMQAWGSRRAASFEGHFRERQR